MVLMVHIQSYSRGAKYDMMLPPASIPPEGTPAARDSHSKQASLRLRFGHDTANDPSLIQLAAISKASNFILALTRVAAPGPETESRSGSTISPRSRPNAAFNAALKLCELRTCTPLQHVPKPQSPVMLCMGGWFKHCALSTGCSQGAMS